MKFGTRGQSLIEAVIALGALILIISGISVVVTGSLNNSSFIDNQNQASKYAQEGLSFFTNLRNSDYITFNSLKAKESSKYYCMGEPVSGFTAGSAVSSIDSCPTIAPSNSVNTFKRGVQFSDGTTDCGDPREIKVTVTVGWSTGKCTGATTYCQQSVLSSCFVDRYNPAPIL